MRAVRERERKGEIPILMIVWSRGQKLHELETLCPEYPGKFPEYPGCYNPTPLKKSRPEI